MRLLHCADVHLETTFAGRGGARRRMGLAEAFARVVDLALERRADALTIGGDLYEAERAGPQTARFVFAQLARFGGPVYVAPGNHDPHVPGSLFARADVPPAVRVFGRAAWRPETLAPGVTLYGFGHDGPEPGRPFSGARFDAPGVRLAMVHGSDEARCPDGKRATAPFTAAEVAASGAALLLTGHYHGGYVAEHAGRPVLAYPGSPEPIGLGESPVHGALVVDADERGVHVEHVALARSRLAEVACDCAGAASEYDAIARAEAALAPYGALDHVRLRLHGAVLAGTRVDAAALAERFAPALGSLEVRDATVADDPATIALEPTVRGRVARELLALGPAGDAALRYALAALDGREIAP